MSYLARRYRRLRRRLRMAIAAGTIWKPLAIGEAAAILCVLGFGAGLVLRAGLTSAVNHIAPLAQTGGRAAKATAAASPLQASAPASARPSNSPSPQLSEVTRLAVSEATARTGIAYTEGGCAGGQSCFSAAHEVDGQDAAFVQLSVRGYGGASLCYVYLENPGGWQVAQMACGASAGFAPAQDVTASVHAPGTCGRLRRVASVQGAVVRCLNNATAVAVTGPPILAEGVLWWPAATASAGGVIAQDLLIDPAAIVPPKS
jgi:hypothetical protein